MAPTGPLPPPDDARLRAALRRHHAGQRLLWLAARARERDRLAARLAAAGLVVDTAIDETAAPCWPADRPPDLVLVDTGLFGAGGDEAPEAGLRRIARALQAPGMDSLPVVAIDDRWTMERRQRYGNHGVVDQLDRPVDLALLQSMLLRRLPWRESAPEAAAELMQRLHRVDGYAADTGLANVGGQLAMLRRVLASFAALYRDGLPSLLPTIAAGDGRAARQLLHPLRGACVTIGCSALAQRLCDGEERLRRAGWPDDVAALAGDAAAMHAAVCATTAALEAALTGA